MILCEEGDFLGVVGVLGGLRVAGVLGRVGNAGGMFCYLDRV